MDFNYQNPSRKVVPKLWSAEKKERKWVEELKQMEKRI